MRLTHILIIIASLVLAGSAGAETNPQENTSPGSGLFKINQSTSYSTAIGIRGIGTSGFTLKHFTGSQRAIEGIVGFGPDAFSVTLLTEKYSKAFDEPGLSWYYGIGGHVATETQWVNYRTDIRAYQREANDFGIGVDGIFGIEYKINEVPIAISFDVKPFLEVTTGGNAYLALDPGLGVKFTF